eukprot:3745950-Rhodomonas_salina.1
MDGILGSCDPYVVLRFGGQVPARVPPTQHAAPCPEHPGCGLCAEGGGWRAGSRSTRQASRRARLPRNGTKSTALYQPPPLLFPPLTWTMISTLTWTIPCVPDMGHTVRYCGALTWAGSRGEQAVRGEIGPLRLEL